MSVHVPHHLSALRQELIFVLEFTPSTEIHSTPGYKTGVRRSDLGNRHAPTAREGAWPPGVKRRRRLFRTATRGSGSPLLPARFAREMRR